MRGDKECPFSGLTKSGRVWRKVRKAVLRVWLGVLPAGRPSILALCKQSTYPSGFTVLYRVPGEIKRGEMELDPHVSPEEIMSREVVLGCESWTSFASSFSSTAADMVFVTLPSATVQTAIAQCAGRCAMARGHRLNTFIVLAAVHGLSGLFRAISAVEFSLFRPLSLPPPPPPPPGPSP